MFVGKSIALFLSSLFFCFSFSQNKSEDTIKKVFSAGLRAHYSYLFIHAKNLIPDDDYFPRGIEADFNFLHVSQQAWEQCNCYPKSGLLITYWDYDRPDVLGYGYGASWYVEPVFRAYRRLSFSTRAAVGLAYVTKPYDSILNPHNQAYSMYITGYLLVNVGLQWKMTDRFQWNAALNINHNSNGGLKDPNKGLNFPSVSLGLDYTPRPAPLKKREKTGSSKVNRKVIRKEILLFYSNRAVSHGEKKRYQIFGIAGAASKRVSRLSAVSAGGEFWIDYALKEKLKRKGYGDRDYKRAGILIGHEFLMGKFTFSQQIGIYVYNPAKFSDWYFGYHDAIYQRYGLKYQLGKHVLLGVQLKADRYIANFVDFRVGAVF